ALRRLRLFPRAAVAAASTQKTPASSPWRADRRRRMGLDFAIDELYATGWLPLDTSGCKRAPDGRAYPSLERARREFAQQGFELTVRHVPAFGCYQAQWSGADEPGAV